MKRTAFLVYGVLCYAIFFASFLYAIGFVGNLWVPKSIDSAPTSSFLQALLTNLGLLGVFALQHSVMARPAFKRQWTRIVSPVIERSTYVLFTSIALLAMFGFWQPMGGVVWTVQSPLLQAILYAMFGIGWLTVLVSTFLINHFDLFGLRQVWLAFRGRPYTPVSFKNSGPYRWVRHPIYLGFLLAFWGAPVMTVAHLVFAVMCTAYILIGIQLEERDLQDAIPEYARYREEVSMLIPRPPKTVAPVLEPQA